jgi:hypothetical protein
MTEHDPFSRFAALGGGNLPAPAAPAAPATPTDRLNVDGVELAVSDRLMALAKICDAHRSASRAANDRMHTAREAIADRQMRIQRQQGAARGSAFGEAEIATLRAEIDQFTSTRATAQAEAEAAAAAFGDAQNLLTAAIKFAREHGATLPVTLQSEGR